jgi:hypothetical protein
LRLSALGDPLGNEKVTYGWNTHSFLNSTEHRQMKAERAELTKKFEATHREKFVILLCHCRSFRFSHLPSEHDKLRSDWDWREAVR